MIIFQFGLVVEYLNGDRLPGNYLSVVAEALVGLKSGNHVAKYADCRTAVDLVDNQKRSRIWLLGVLGCLPEQPLRHLEPDRI